MVLVGQLLVNFDDIYLEKEKLKALTIDLYAGKLCLRPCGTECREFDRDSLEFIRL